MNNNYTEILIVFSAATSVLREWKGVAAAVWSVQPPGLDENGLGLIGAVGTTVSESADSDGTEIVLLGLNDALRSVNGPQVRVFVTQSWITEGINGGAERWEIEKWKDRPYKEHWQAFLEILRQKGLQVHGEHIAAADPRFAGDIRLLRKWAREARDKRAKELGTPTAPFDPWPTVKSVDNGSAT